MTVGELHARMEAAAARQDFEEAARLRNLIALARQTDADPTATDVGVLQRQQPGAMGIGSSQPIPTRPAGWVRPKKPDPMTRNRSR